MEKVIFAEQPITVTGDKNAETYHQSTKKLSLSNIFSFLSDTLFESFLSLRLGNRKNKDLSCLYMEFPKFEENYMDAVGCTRRVMYADVPERPSKQSVRVIVISDTHERHTALGTLPPCDILIHAGDILMTNRMMSAAGAARKAESFDAWLRAQPAQHRVVVAGNHDHILETLGPDGAQRLLPSATYLCNSGAELMGLRLWGTPLSHGRSANRAFQSPAFRAAALRAAAALPPRGVDVLISHGPEGTLARAVAPRTAHAYGHVHALHGVRWVPRGGGAPPPPAPAGAGWVSVCGAVMDGGYAPRQLPIVLDVAPPPPAPAAASGV